MRAASDTLDMATSSVSRQISKLERELGLPLVEKGVRRIKLTEMGEAACRYYREKASHEEAFWSKILDHKSVRTGKVTIAIGEALINEVFSTAIREFMVAYPGLSVIVRVGGTPEVIAKVRDDDAHMGLIFDTARDAKIRTRLALPQPLKIILSPRNKLSKKKSLKLSDIVDENVCLPEQDFRIRQVVEHAEIECGVFLETVMETNALQLMKGIVESGHGITVLPEIFIRDSLEKGDLVAVPTDSKILNGTKFTLITRVGRQLPLGAHRFMMMLEAHLRPLLDGSAKK
jgi:DNA-binding transcriptional LysR family regulator